MSFLWSTHQRKRELCTDENDLQQILQHELPHVGAVRDQGPHDRWWVRLSLVRRQYTTIPRFLFIGGLRLGVRLQTIGGSAVPFATWMGCGRRIAPLVGLDWKVFVYGLYMGGGGVDSLRGFRHQILFFLRLLRAWLWKSQPKSLDLGGQRLWECWLQPTLLVFGVEVTATVHH